MARTGCVFKCLAASLSASETFRRIGMKSKGEEKKQRRERGKKRKRMERNRWEKRTAPDCRREEKKEDKEDRKRGEGGRRKEGRKEEREEGRQEGRKERRKEGRKERRKDGRKEEREEGRKEGRREGRKERGKEGRKEGRKERRKDGRKEGGKAGSPYLHWRPFNTEYVEWDNISLLGTPQSYTAKLTVKIEQNRTSVALNVSAWKLIHLVSVIKSAARHVRLTKLGWLTENYIDLSSSHVIWKAEWVFSSLFTLW